MIPDTWSSGPESDLRFQFEVIKSLSDSVKAQTDTLRGVQQDMRSLYEGQAKANERLAAIEANRINETVVGLSEFTKALQERVDKLESDKDIRDGGSAMRRAVMYWWPAIGLGFMVLWTLARAVGIITIPSDAPRQPAQRPGQVAIRPVEPAPERPAGDEELLGS